MAPSSYTGFNRAPSLFIRHKSGATVSTESGSVHRFNLPQNLTRTDLRRPRSARAITSKGGRIPFAASRFAPAGSSRISVASHRSLPGLAADDRLQRLLDEFQAIPRPRERRALDPASPLSPP